MSFLTPTKLYHNQSLLYVKQEIRKVSSNLSQQATQYTDLNSSFHDILASANNTSIQIPKKDNKNEKKYKQYLNKTFFYFLKSINFVISHYAEIPLKVSQEEIHQNIQKPQYNRIKLNKLIYIKDLGEGQYGKTYLVYDNVNKQIFCLKWISQYHVQQPIVKNHLMQELEVQRNINFQFIVKYFRFFEYQNNNFFLNEFVQGVEMSTQLEDLQSFSIKRSQFYIAQLILCLEYLHSKNIVYRDLKPENIMIDQDGYIKLVDMGACKILNEKNQSRTKSIIGTPYYMAPEVIAGIYYSFYVDFWSLGIISYEFLCGDVPFDFETQDPMIVYQNILSRKLSFPENLQNNKPAVDFIQLLLNKSPQERKRITFQQLKNHQFFKGFSWENLIKKNIKPEFIPKRDHNFQKEIENNKKLNISILNKINFNKQIRYRFSDYIITES